MRVTPTAVRCSNASRPGERPVLGGLLLAALLAVGSVGCGPADEAMGMPEVVLGTQVQEESGIITNGIITNGIITNGIITNGIITNGLSNLTLGSGDFSTWFEQNAEKAPEFMEYVVRCAVPSGETRTYTNPTTGVSYTWPGGLGLAPGWASGKQATVAEQQVVTACIAAHANKYGLHITLAMLGQDAQGVPLTFTSSELSTYSEREACFFGNIFTGGAGVLYAANDRNYLRASESTPRACGLSSRSGSTDCPPITHVGHCGSYCTLDSTRTYYTSCTYNGVTYKPFTTRIRPADIYTCGDGVCQFTESCGTGSTYDSCAADCGACR